jgi:glycosyltransferase involved in cell wall biosynthesis
LAANIKVELITKLLQQLSHDVEVISQGEVVDSHFRHFASFKEGSSAHAFPVFYASALPLRYLNGWWSEFQTRKLLQRRHSVSPFDLLIVYNLKGPQVRCAMHAVKRLRLPVVVEYEDDAFVTVNGHPNTGYRTRHQLRAAAHIIASASGCIGVSPYVLSRVPASIPRLLLRGIVGEEILSAVRTKTSPRNNWIVYSGTHYRSKGLEQMLKAWKMAPPDGWELHLSGRGELTPILERMADNRKDIIFHGMINREEHARLLQSARITINPHDISQTPGNVFAFKIMEYLAAGSHCITTPMGVLEPELEAGITYMHSNSPEIISATIHEVIRSRAYENTAASAAQKSCGLQSVAEALQRFLSEATSS